MMAIGFDISEYQSGVPASDFSILRAANGRREDFQFAQFAAATVGQPRGAYCYAEPNNGQSPEQQADRFCGIVAGAGGAWPLGLWLDLEEGTGDLVGFALRFMARVLANGFPVGLYTGASFLRNQLGAQSMLAQRPLWLAAYGPNDGAMHPISPAPPWAPAIHQFTSNPLDTNYTANLAALTGGSTVDPTLAATLQYIVDLLEKGPDNTKGHGPAYASYYTLTTLQQFIANFPAVVVGAVDTAVKALPAGAAVDATALARDILLAAGTALKNV